ncbi:hypothetical protein TMUPMC115_1585 [Tetragenococcus muriaticus PMC-11-5]|uniref:Uncharacterized protein n=2 Tax=Tetragenococcus muriaticus TaxID=64642 RepID=A0A091C3H1_9ENTE|nr:hypothetical protein TMU3MR103_1408 [Tetragenococcus muriaticus 3MR10-3]KFN91119.1 hypothetical protein TMUPMC115_1585 [Tetragenococcus muriaticus PMC-11-5]
MPITIYIKMMNKMESRKQFLFPAFFLYPKLVRGNFHY